MVETGFRDVYACDGSGKGGRGWVEVYEEGFGFGQGCVEGPGDWKLRKVGRSRLWRSHDLRRRLSLSSSEANLDPVPAAVEWDSIWLEKHRRLVLGLGTTLTEMHLEHMSFQSRVATGSMSHPCFCPRSGQDSCHGFVQLKVIMLSSF